MLCTIELVDPLMVCFLTNIFMIFIAYFYMCLNDVVYCAMFGVNHTCILGVFFMYIYNSNARFTSYSSILH